MARNRRIDGYSESLWKSLAVKSLRMGWPAGLEAAAERLPPRKLEDQLWCGVFEDIFPTEDDVARMRELIEARAFRELCQLETHHGRGYSDEFCDLKDRAVPAGKDEAEKAKMYPEARKRDVYIPWRAFNCFWTWLQIRPERGGERELDEREFERIPKVMADSHTYEGYQLHQHRTILSGHYEQHRKLGELVMNEGWGYVRRVAHAEPMPQPSTRQENLDL